MAQTIATDSKYNDFVKVGHSLAMRVGLPAVGNICNNRRLQVFQEAKFAIQDGVDYFNTLLTDQPSIELFQQSLGNNLMAVPEVQKILDFRYEVQQQNGRSVIVYSIRLDTTEGEIILTSNEE